MAIQDVGIRFTEENYATKDEVKSAYNMSMIDNIWEKVTAYRSHFARPLGLKTIDNTPFNLTLSKSIQNKLGILERRLSKILVRYISLSPTNKNAVKDQVFLRCYREIARADGQEISNDMLLHLIHRDISAFPANLSQLFYYNNTLDFFFDHRYDPLDHKLLCHLNLRLSGEEEVDLSTLELAYRREELDTPHYFQVDYIYKAAPISEVSKLLTDLFDFVNSEEFSPIVRALISIFYLDYIKPFDYLNEETSAIFSKLILAKSDYEEAGFFPLLEAISFDRSAAAKNVKELAQKTLDLTYYLDYYLDVIDKDLVELLEILSDLDTLAISQETRPNLEEEKEEGLETPGTTAFSPSDITVPIPDSLRGKSEVALPVFPSGIEAGAIDGIVLNLLEVYPYLKRTQAHFYAAHCTIGKHYTIAQFKKEEGVAYETARTSMDFLADQGFYSKSQVRNKFVYTPVPRR